MTLPQELVERELGKFMLKLLKGTDVSAAISSAAEHTAVQALQQVQDILGDQTLSDFQCIEKIVATLESFGLSGHRHDF